MTEREFLELNVFYDLKNLNIGYDDDSIWHFNADDFQIVMDRAEDLNLNILGIECWENEQEKFTKYYENYSISKWYRKAFQELVDHHSPCIYTATFDIPPYFLQEHIRD